MNGYFNWTEILATVRQDTILSLWLVKIFLLRKKLTFH